VDDNLALSESLRDVLLEEGYDVHLARNGLEGLSLARATRPDLIVLDMLMPVLDGWEFRRAQRADPTLAEIPVLVLSAVDDDLGADDERYFTKPFGISALLSSIRRMAPQRAGT
jgi:CheY-like chemotaxis protein